MSVVMKKSLVSLLFCICTPFFLGSARAAYSAAAGQLVSSSPLAAKAGGSGDSGLAILSPDGRFVLFASTANNLTPTNNYFAVVPTRCNLYLRDTWSDTTTLVSVNQAGSGGRQRRFLPDGALHQRPVRPV